MDKYINNFHRKIIYIFIYTKSCLWYEYKFVLLNLCIVVLRSIIIVRGYYIAKQTQDASLIFPQTKAKFSQTTTYYITQTQYQKPIIPQSKCNPRVDRWYLSTRKSPSYTFFRHRQNWCQSRSTPETQCHTLNARSISISITV